MCIRDSSSDTKATFEAGKANAVFEKFKFIFSKFTSFFKSPTGIAKEFADKKDSTYGILMICTNIIVTFLMFFIPVSYTHLLHGFKLVITATFFPTISSCL